METLEEVQKKIITEIESDDNDVREKFLKHFKPDIEKFIDAMEGLQVQSPAGRIEMRACDHQAILPMYFGVTKLSPELGVAISTDIHSRAW